ncbi:carbohydrate porin [Microbulbifer sp.]|uniref:carbohydrate porin n=1 Tax=Microbulbifer sp. TaxID=1908541 RepID=UPI003F3E6087
MMHQLGGRRRFSSYTPIMKKVALCSSFASFFAVSPLLASDEVSTPYFDRLTGFWGGRRTELSEQGFEFFAYYNAIIASNVAGGIRSETNYAGDLFTGINLDLERLIGWQDTVFTLSATNKHGSDITPSVGSQYSVMQVVGGQTTFLYNVTLEKGFADDDILVKFGRMTAGDDFVGSPFYTYSLNNAVNGQIRAVLFDGVMTAYPFAVWGGRVKAKPAEDHTLQVGLFQLTDDMFDPDKHGLDFGFSSDDGVSIFLQYDWTPKFKGRPARFYGGLNQNFGFDMDKFNSPDTLDRFTRFYGGADYQFCSEAPGSEEGLYLFATLAYTSREEVAIMPVQSSLGVHYKGLFAERPDDRTVFFVTYGQFSDDYSDEQVAAGGSEVDYEMVFELGHRIQVAPYAYIQPDIQFIKNPGGTGRIADATVLGVQFGISF